MPVRAATRSDLISASKILTAAFYDDFLFGSFIHPRRNEFPDDVYLYWLRFLREAYHTEGEYLIVSYRNQPADSGHEPITGVAHWIRNSSQPPRSSWVSQVMLKAVTLYNKAEDFVWRNRAIDHAHDAVLGEGYAFFSHHWSGSRANSWHLSLIGVDPASERRGLGRELVQWGFERSLQEGVACSVISVPGQEPFYRACGFDKVVGTTNDDGGDENAWKAAELEPFPIRVCDHGKEPEELKKDGEN